MPIFPVNRGNLQSTRFHKRLRQRLRTDHQFEDVRLERSSPRDPGPFRVKADVDPQMFLDDSTYPTRSARLEVGFDLFTQDAYEHYWLNWIDPDRSVLVGWHQDDTHPGLGPVHVRVNDGDNPVARESATVIDTHPLDVFSRRLAQLPGLIRSVEWTDDLPVGFE